MRCPVAPHLDRVPTGRNRSAVAGNDERRSHYITPEGFERLREEYEQLWKVERPKVTEAVSVAAALGDRSENADYIYGKKRLREIDRRVRYLSKRMDELTVVHPDTSREGDRIFFGAWVTLQDEEGETVQYRIVGPDESEPESGHISMDSPVGRSLIGRSVDDAVVVVRPRGRTEYVILAVRYSDAPGSERRS
ncbi:MAG: transcription elongation factor GreB [Deltaproteobacteria bacterium]|nr:transcription elongation factor GreB [Deltaproteobacteria bacterium]MBW2698826.1 transcription elongation factor GreB [Deltaproteobacteria bacterium]